MDRNKRWFAISLIVGTLLIASTGYSANPESHRILDVKVTKITGDMLFYQTEEGTTRNIALKIVEKYEKIQDVRVGDHLTIEFDEGNQVIRINRPDSFKVSGQVVEFDSAERKVTLKLKDGTTQTYTVIPPAATKMAVVPKGTTVVLDIDKKNNFVKDFEQQK